LGKYETLHDVIEHGGPEVAELVHRLSVEETDAEAVDVASRLWERFLEREIEQCRLAARDVDAATYAQLVDDMRWFRLQLEDLREPERKASTVEGLLGWMVEDSKESS
jgi:hypothetical protein